MKCAPASPSHAASAIAIAIRLAVRRVTPEVWSMLPILAVVCAPGATVAGIDVDQNAGTVDWNMVRAAGKELAYAAIGDGLAPDAQFSTNYAGMLQAGIIRGGYFLFEPGTDPHQQANLVI